MEFKDFFKGRLRGVPKERKETPAETAKGVGMSTRYYQNLELGVNLPGLEHFFALADYFGVSLDYLAGRTEERKK